MAEKFPPMSDFARAFAAEYKGFMKAAQVTGADVAAKLGRNAGYVSERANGKRALDTNDVDALASLVDGWTGKTLLAELARRVRESTYLAPVTEIRPGVGGPVEDGDRDELGAVAKSKSRDRGGDDGQG